MIWKSDGHPILNNSWIQTESNHFPILNDRIAYVRGWVFEIRCWRYVGNVVAKPRL